MPFTFSHAAAAVPLARRLPLPLSTLVVGSMSPDFIYFMALQASGSVGHTFWGLFTFCLPTSLGVLWLWHRLMKQPAAALLPAWVGQRVASLAAEPFAFGPGRRFVQVAAGILLGAVTHIVWDAFTHFDGWMAEVLPVLRREVPFPFFGTMPVYKLGQLLSSAVGGLLLAWWTWQWLRRQPAGAVELPLANRLAWALSLSVSAATLAVSYARWHAAPLTSYLALRLFVLQIIVAACTALWLGLLGFACWYRLRQQKAEPVGSA
jgi:hypothetical protein